jgi:excisionase family DNA binding protein
VKVITIGLEDFRAVLREVLGELLERPIPASPAAAGPEMLTTEQAAAELQVQPATVADWIRSGRLRATRPGGRQYRISREDLEAAKRGPRSDVDVTSEVRRISALLHRTRR